jgi:hypothetical protein
MYTHLRRSETLYSIGGRRSFLVRQAEVGSEDDAMLSRIYNTTSSSLDAFRNHPVVLVMSVHLTVCH